MVLIIMNAFVAGLMSSNYLYPFMNRGIYNDEKEIYDLNAFTQAGTYIVTSTYAENTPISSGTIFVCVFDFSFQTNIRSIQLLFTETSFYFRALTFSGWKQWIKL